AAQQFGDSGSRPGATRNYRSATRPSLERAGGFAFGYAVRHPLYVGAPQVASRDSANQRLDMPGDAPFINRHRGEPLRALEPGHDQPSTRRIEIFGARLSDN